MTTIHDLTTEIHRQLERLSDLQEEIGYSETEKKVKADSLLDSVKTFVETQIESVVKEKETIIQEAENTQKSILSFKKLMGEFASNKVVLDPSLSLQVNLTHLQQEKNEVEQVMPWPPCTSSMCLVYLSFFFFFFLIVAI